MNLRSCRAPAVLLVLAVASLPSGCALVSEHNPPDGAWFDVVGHPTGGVPATLGYYAGVTAWTPFGFVLGGLLPSPLGELVSNGPGEVLGVAAGGVLGAPFHLAAWPFSGGGEEPEAPGALDPPR